MKKIVLAIIILLFIGCNDFKIGSFSTTLPNSRKSKFIYFTGIDEVYIGLKENQVLSLNYEKTIKKGDLSIKIVVPSRDEIIELDKSKGKITLQSEKDQRVELIVNGNKARGKYELRWNIGQDK